MTSGVFHNSLRLRGHCVRVYVSTQTGEIRSQPCTHIDTIHRTTPRHQTVLTQNFPKTLTSPQNLRRHRVQKSQIHTEAPRYTIQSPSELAPRICAPPPTNLHNFPPDSRPFTRPLCPHNNSRPLTRPFHLCPHNTH